MCLLFWLGRIGILIMPDIQIIGRAWKPAKWASAAQSWFRPVSAVSSALKKGGLVVAEERSDGILIRPAVAVPVEIYTPERKAEFLLSNAVDADDYQAALQEVRKMGINSSTVPHHRLRKPSRT